MSLEQVPLTPSPEQPPLAPYDPPAPAPQAAAWRLALRVISTASDSDDSGRSRVAHLSERRASRHFG